jgi:hypothetical protein
MKKQPYDIVQLKLATTLSSEALQSEIERHLAADPELNSAWLVPSSSCAFEIHGLELHGFIQCYHFHYPSRREHADFTMEFRQGDTAMVQHLIALLGAPVEGEILTWIQPGEKIAPAESELAQFINSLKGEPFEDSVLIAGTAVESARCCVWNDQNELMDELFFLTEIPVLLENGGIQAVEKRERINQACRVWPNSKTIWFRGEKLALVHRAHLMSADQDEILVLHFARDLKTGKVVVGYVTEENKI